MATFEILRREGTPFIELVVESKEPIELGDLAALLIGFEDQFKSYIRHIQPDAAKDLVLLVRDIRPGSTRFELVPYLMTLYQSIDMGVTIDAFVKRMREVIGAYASGQPAPEASKSDVASFHDVLKVIARDESGSVRIASAEYHEKKSVIRSSFKFDTSEARPALETVERQRRIIELPAHEVVENALMTYWQSNIANTDSGKRTGEKVVIESVSSKPLAIVYATNSAKEKIKHEIAVGDRNIYKLGFYVDCHVEKLNGRPVAYKLTAVRDIIDLPDDSTGQST